MTTKIYIKQSYKKNKNYLERKFREIQRIFAVYMYKIDV